MEFNVNDQLWELNRQVQTLINAVQALTARVESLESHRQRHFSPVTGEYIPPPPPGPPPWGGPTTPSQPPPDPQFVKHLQEGMLAELTHIRHSIHNNQEESPNEEE